METSVVVKDVIEWSEKYRGPKFHAMLCDPPYHLTSIVKRFKKVSDLDRKLARSTPHRRTSSGFMGQTWDGGDIAFDPQTWAALGQHLLPGAFGMAFASSRGWHRLAVAIEDAGFVIHPTIFGWLYSSGFPKATNLSKQIDRSAGAKRKVVGKMEKPATALSQVWSGHRYGLQALKPALEPIIVFQRPYQGKPVENITLTGAGALNIYGARIPTDSPYTINTWDDGAHPFGNGAGNPFTGRQVTSRWPANFVLDDGAAEILGEDAQFFFQFQQDALDEADEVKYQPKANGREREAGLEDMPLKESTKQFMLGMEGAVHSDGRARANKPILNRNPHPTVKPIQLSRWLATLLLPPQEYAPRRILVPFSGSGSEMIGAGLAGWEAVTGIEKSVEYAEIAVMRIAHWLGQPRQMSMWE